MAGEFIMRLSGSLKGTLSCRHQWLWVESS